MPQLMSQIEIEVPIPRFVVHQNFNLCCIGLRFFPRSFWTQFGELGTVSFPPLVLFYRSVFPISFVRTGIWRLRW